METLSEVWKGDRQFIETGVISLTTLVVAFLLIQDEFPVPDWGTMWLVAVLVYGLCKLLTYIRSHDTSNHRRTLYYFFFEPGLNANRFLASRNRPSSPGNLDWLKGFLFLMLGFVCMYSLAPLTYEISAGWAAAVGMVGVVMILHFGILDVLSTWLRAQELDSTALMNDPWKAGSVAEFWSRWNTGFRDFSRQMIFYPLVRRKHTHAGLWLTFLFSGLVHDLVISLPARGGYGGPTIYFLMQGLAIDFERTRFAKRLHITRGAFRWIWTAAVILLPVSLLFHQPFRENIVLPMLHDLRALP